MRPSVVSRLRVLLAAALFSTGGAAIKATSLSSWQVASFRSAIGALAVLVLLPAARRRWSWRSAAVGVAYAATVILFVRANKLTTAANAVFIQATSPLYVLLLSGPLLGEPVRRRDVAYLAVLAAGFSLFFLGSEPPLRTAPDPLQGNLLAAACGVTTALMAVGVRWLARTGHSGGSAGAAVVLGNLIAFVGVLPWALPVSAAAAWDWLVLGYLGVFQLGLAWVSLAGALRHVSALEASLLLLLEPVLNPVWAWLVHGERPGSLSLAGGAVVLLSTVARTGLDIRLRR